MWKNDSIKVVICAVLFILSGCDSRQDDAVGKTNTIKILEIQPPVSAPLKTGQKINIKVKLAYELESKAATVTLAVLRSEGFGNKSLTSNFAVIQQGKGEVLLTGEFFVPKTRILQVRIPLIPQQRNDSAPVETRTYNVIQ